MFVYLHLWNTLEGLVIIYGAVTFPFVVWLMRSFFQDVPREISRGRDRRRLHAVGGVLQGGAAAWSRAASRRRRCSCSSSTGRDYLIALVMTQDHWQTAPLFLHAERRRGRQEYGHQAALAVLLILPPAILGLSIQKYLVRGLTFGAIKR